MTPAPSNDKIQFWDDHRPALEDGDYTITVTQHIATQNNPPQNINGQSDFTVTRNFSVLGPRFSLDPQEVRAVFPPDGSLGEHSNVLPHIVFNRATLPWERSANPTANGRDDSQDPPWLMLLVFDEGDQPVPTLQTVKLSDLGFPNDWNPSDETKKRKEINGSVFYVGLKPEYGQHVDDQVQLITVSADLLKAMVPAKCGPYSQPDVKYELDWLAHVRQSQATDATGAPASEPFAVLFANRLPTPNGQTTVHLVSLEGLYDANGDFYYSKDENKNIALISLVSLKSWRFACVSPQHDFKNILLNVDAQSFRLPIDVQKQPTATPYLQQGLAPFVHAMRQGNRSVSWYRGPLLPGANTNVNIQLPILNTDSLVHYYTDIGMFDVTYAAAWELGRLLALQNKRVSVDLFNWKRAHAQQQKDAENQLEHLPLMGQSPTAPEDMPASVTTWYQQLNLLNGIPFNYLVPDERMLPTESIRFFQVDPLWIECLLDGAFAVGRVLKEDQDLKNNGKAPVLTYENMSGFLLRSAVVAGYPDLQVDGFSSTTLSNSPAFPKPFPTPLSANELQQAFSNIPELGAQELGRTADAMWQLITDSTPPHTYLLKRTLDTYQLFDPSLKKILDANPSDVVTLDASLKDVGPTRSAPRTFPPSITSLIKDPIKSILLQNAETWQSEMDQQGNFYLVKRDEINIIIVVYLAKLPILPMRRLSSNVLLCLFEGQIAMVDIHQKPESLHFGFDTPDKVQPNYYKALRDLETGIENETLLPVTVSWRGDSKNRVVNIDQLQKDIKTNSKATSWNVAQFAMQMIEGVEKVQLLIKGA